jgi:hypothetical protein
MKLVICGHGRHGKDTVGEIIRELTGMTFRSSSDICCEHAVFPTLSKKYGYKTLEECYADRINHRKEWFDLIVEYNTPDLAKLGRIILTNYDMYVG